MTEYSSKLSSSLSMRCDVPDTDKGPDIDVDMGADPEAELELEAWSAADLST